MPRLKILRRRGLSYFGIFEKQEAQSSSQETNHNTMLGGFVGLPSSAPLNRRVVLLWGVLGRGGHLDFSCSGCVGAGLMGRCCCVRCCCRARPYGQACCACAWPACMVGRLCSRTARLHARACVAGPLPSAMVGCAMFVTGQPDLSGVCACAWPASILGRALLVRDPPPWSMCCVGAGPAAMVGRCKWQQLRARIWQ